MLKGRTAIRNTCIANVLSYVGLIEHWGTGIQRVLTLCKEAGIKEPEFIDFGDALRVNIYRPIYVEPINEQINQELSKNAQVVFAKIKEILDANRDELAVLCGLSLATIKRALKKLKEKGYISGKTSNKTGKRIVNNE